MYDDRAGAAPRGDLYILLEFVAICWPSAAQHCHLKGCSANAVTVIKKYIQTLYSTIYKQKWKMVRKSIKVMHSPPLQENEYPQQNLHEWIIKRETQQTSSPLNWNTFRSSLPPASGSKISSLTAPNQSDFAPTSPPTRCHSAPDPPIVCPLH